MHVLCISTQNAENSYTIEEKLIMNILTDKLVGMLIDEEIITSTEKEVYVYGIHQSLIILSNLAITIILGVISSMIWESIVFMFAYISIRIYAGGYHAETQLRCYVVSILINILALIEIKCFLFNGQWANICLIISQIIIMILAPVEAENKLLTTKEKVIYRKHVYVLVCLYDGIFLLCKFIGGRETANCISTAMGMAMLMIILGKVKWHKILKTNNRTKEL